MLYGLPSPPTPHIFLYINFKLVLRLSLMHGLLLVQLIKRAESTLHRVSLMNRWLIICWQLPCMNMRHCPLFYSLFFVDYFFQLLPFFIFLYWISDFTPLMSAVCFGCLESKLLGAWALAFDCLLEEREGWSYLWFEKDRRGLALLLPLKWGLINANAVIAVALPSVYYCFLSFHLECSAFVLHCRRRRRRSWYLIDCQVYSNWPIQSSLKCCWLLAKREERLAGLLWLASVIRLLVELLAELWWPVQSVTGAVDSVEVKTK